jgi:hypothetical protein
MDAPTTTRDMGTMGRITVDLIMADPITAGPTMVDIPGRLWWQSVIALTTLVVPDTTQAARIMFGSPAIGGYATDSESGSTANT